MSNLAPCAGNPAAAATARAILTDPQLCADRPSLVTLAWVVLHSNRGAPAIQSRLPRPAPAPRGAA